jgi:hypothetical protein
MKITKSQLKQIIKEELEGTISEDCGGTHPEAVITQVPGPFEDQNVKVWELLTTMGLSGEQIAQVKDVIDLNKAETEVEDSFGIKLEDKSA